MLELVAGLVIDCLVRVVRSAVGDTEQGYECVSGVLTYLVLRIEIVGKIGLWSVEEAAKCRL